MKNSWGFGLTVTDKPVVMGGKHSKKVTCFDFKRSAPVQHCYCSNYYYY